MSEKYTVYQVANAPGYKEKLNYTYTWNVYKVGSNRIVAAFEEVELPDAKARAKALCKELNEKAIRFYVQEEGASFTLMDRKYTTWAIEIHARSFGDAKELAEKLCRDMNEKYGQGS